jgi:hypothetical protein
MKVINPNNTTHEITLIPRYYPTGVIVLQLYDEVSQVFNDVPNLYLVENGVMTISFDFNFDEGGKYQLKITQDGDIIYRGKLKVTSQNTQEFKDTNDLYFYE